MRVRGRTALITGGASGIGLALAKALVARGCEVVIVGRDELKLEAAQRETPLLHILRADICDEAQRLELVAKVRRRFPTLDLLVNNAAVAFFNDLDRDEDFYQRVRLEAETNYLAPVRLTQLLMEQLRQQPSAAVLNIGTAATIAPLAQMPGYSASKAALSAFMRALRHQLADTNVRVFQVLAPPVDTALVASFELKKMPAEDFAQHVLRGLEKDRFEMAIGSARGLRLLSRLAPRMTESAAHDASVAATAGTSFDSPEALSDTF